MGRKIISIIFLALLAGSSMIWSSCAKDESAAMKLEIKRLQARSEVQNLMGRYAFYHTSGMNFVAAEKLFTTYADTVIEMMWGRFTGKDAAYRAYTIGHRNYDQPAITALKIDIPALTADQMALISDVKAAPADAAAEAAVPAAGAASAVGAAHADKTGAASAAGVKSLTTQEAANPDTMQSPENTVKTEAASLHVHTLTTPVIEVAGDGETARAVWMCPGLEGLTPVWVKYGCDFKKQDGEWRIWHLHVYGMTTGLEAKDTFTPNMTPSKGADKAPTTNWEYSKTAKYIPYEPEPPQPYATWDYNKMIPKSYGDPN